MRSIGTARMAKLMAAVALVACQGTGTEPRVDRNRPSHQIMDAAHDAAANPDFFFLPPLLPDPSGHPEFDADAFDATLSPVVEICQSDGTRCLPAAQQTDGFPIASGSDVLDAVSVSEADQQYRLNWHTDRSVLNANITYRIRVLVAGTELGYADVDVVSNGRELKRVETGEFIPLLNGRTLPIKFRIERGAVFVVGASGGTVSAVDGAVTLALPEGASGGNVGITVWPATGFPVDSRLVPGSVFDFGPDGAQFAEPVRMTIRYDPDSIPPGGDERSLVLGHAVDGVWTVAAGSTVDVATHTVTGPVRSFSFYAVRLPPLIPPPLFSGPLAFASTRDGDAEIFTWDGTLRQITNNAADDGAPDWLGERIAFSSNRSGNYDIWTVDAEGGSPVNLTNSPGSSEFSPRWSPDGCRIAFVRLMPDGKYDVWVMKADGSGQVNLTNNPASDAGPAWSPNGDRIAFHSNRDGGPGAVNGILEIYAMNSDGSGAPTRLTYDANNDDASPDWSPDGTKIVFSKYVAGTRGAIWIVGADGSNPHAITTSNGTLDYGPAWSPDGSRIAFHRYGGLPSGFPVDIWLVNPDGSGLVAAPAGNGTDAAWKRPAPPEFVSQEAQVSFFGATSWSTTPRLGADALGEIVVFGRMPLRSDGSQLPSEIWYQRLNSDGTPSGAAVRVSDGTTYDQLPDISGHRIVYTAYESLMTPTGRLMLYDIATGSRTPITPVTSLHGARIDGDVVVWIQGLSTATSLMYWDLNWQAGTQPVALAGPNPAAEQVDIGSRFVVWAQRDGVRRDIWAYDRSMGTTAVVAGDPALLMDSPATSGNWVAWMARSATGSISIQGADLANSNASMTLVENGAKNRLPSIDGDLMSFESNVPGQLSVYLYRIADGRSFQVTSGEAYEALHVPNLRGDKIAFVRKIGYNRSEIFVSRFRFACGASCSACGTQPGGGN